MRKKHEIVESVVVSVCEVFGIEDWRALHGKNRHEFATIAKQAIINLLSSEIGCSFSDTHFYFPVYNVRSTYSASQIRFTDALESPDTKNKFNLAKEMAKKYFLLKPDTFDFLIVQ